MEASVRDVAKAASVSVSTVSRAFSHPEMVSETTRKKVMKIAESLSFQVTRSSAALKTGKSFRIAFLTSNDLSEWFDAEILQGMIDIFSPAGYDVVIYHIDTVDKRQDFFDRLPLRRNTDAVVVCSFGVNKAESARLRDVKVPILGINPPSPVGFDLTVSIDDNQAMTAVVSHLAGLGHHHLAYVQLQSPLPLFQGQDKRLKAFIAACKREPRISSYNLVKCPAEEDPINSAIQKLLALNPPPTAVCFQNDGVALPVLYHLQRYGRKVPGDLSVIGFDDSTMAGQVGLTTIHQSAKSMGSAGAQTLLQVIGGGVVKDRFLTEPTHLILRCSTGRPPR